MFRSILSFCLITSILMSSCGFQEKHDAQEFYYRLTSINDSLDKMVTQWHDSLDQAILKKNYAELSTMRTNLGIFISESRSFVANTPTTAGNERLKKLEDSLLETQSAKVADIYPAFELFSALTPKELLDKNKALLYDDLDGVKMQLGGIKKAGDDFVKKYTLKKKK